MRIQRQRRGSRSGATIVEFAFVCSIYLLFLFGVFEYGRLVWMRQMMQAAAREGARYAVVHTYDGTTADIEGKVRAAMIGADSKLDNFAISIFKAHPSTGANLGAWTDAKFGECIAVEITGDFNTVLPAFLIMDDPIFLRTRTTMYSEAN